MATLVQQPNRRVQVVLRTFPTGFIIPPPFPGITMKKLISDALTNAGLTGSFLEATYDTSARVLVQGGAITPASVEANEVRAQFQQDRRHGRAYQQDRANWIWELHLRFDSEAITEPFEKALLEDPVTVARDEANGVDRQVILNLVDVSYEHPPRGGASNGSKVVFRFSADLCPK